MVGSVNLSHVHMNFTANPVSEGLIHLPDLFVDFCQRMKFELSVANTDANVLEYFIKKRIGYRRSSRSGYKLVAKRLVAQQSVSIFNAFTLRIICSILLVQQTE